MYYVYYTINILYHIVIVTVAVAFFCVFWHFYLALFSDTDKQQQNKHENLPPPARL